MGGGVWCGGGAMGGAGCEGTQGRGVRHASAVCVMECLPPLLLLPCLLLGARLNGQAGALSLSTSLPTRPLLAVRLVFNSCSILTAS